MILSELDKSILVVLYKLYGVQIDVLSVLCGVSEVVLSRRLRTLRERGIVGGFAAFGGEKNVWYLKRKGNLALIEAAVFPFEIKERKEHSKANQLERHTQGEAKVAAWLALPKEAKHVELLRVPFGALQTERDLRGKSIDVVGGRVKNRDRGLHMPDFAFRTSSASYAVEYERTLKPKTATTQTRDNLRANSQRFDRQIWVVETPAIKRQIEAAASGLTGISVILVSAVLADLEAYHPAKSLVGTRFIEATPLRLITRVNEPKTALHA